MIPESLHDVEYHLDGCAIGLLMHVYCVFFAVTFFQWQHGDGDAQSPAAQAHQMRHCRLDLHSLPGVNQIQRRSLQASVRVETVTLKSPFQSTHFLLFSYLHFRRRCLIRLRLEDHLRVLQLLTTHLQIRFVFL